MHNQLSNDSFAYQGLNKDFLLNRYLIIIEPQFRILYSTYIQDSLEPLLQDAPSLEKPVFDDRCGKYTSLTNNDCHFDPRGLPWNDDSAMVDGN